MNSSNRNLAHRAVPHKRTVPVMLHPVESDLAERIATNAAVLRLALARGMTVHRRMLAGLADDMEAWAAELRSEPADMAALVRSAAA